MAHFTMFIAKKTNESNGKGMLAFEITLTGLQWKRYYNKLSLLIDKYKRVVL